jgi:hypothetical protein
LVNSESSIGIAEQVTKSLEKWLNDSGEGVPEFDRFYAQWTLGKVYFLVSKVKEAFDAFEHAISELPRGWMEEDVLASLASELFLSKADNIALMII